VTPLMGLWLQWGERERCGSAEAAATAAAAAAAVGRQAGADVSRRVTQVQVLLTGIRGAAYVLCLLPKTVCCLHYKGCVPEQCPRTSF
jgi:hypothetical protein